MIQQTGGWSRASLMSDMVPIICWKMYINVCQRLSDANFQFNVVGVQFLEELQQCGD